ncbi:MAG TPA: flavin reductase family protein [Stellaceae bacterium]|nr:flavin reductase family protein [Stellaceae bacterium]
MEFDFTTLPPKDRYRLLIGSVVPRPIALVTTLDGRGVPNAAPFSFFNCFSHDPPIVALGMELRAAGGLKDTVRIIRATREFVVNLVDETIAERMNICAVDFPEGVNELAEASLTAVASSVVKPPRIRESPVNMECKLIEELRFGDGGKRSIVLGEVLRFHIRDDVLTERGHIDLTVMRPVGRLAGSGYIRLSDRFDMKRMSHADWQAKKRNGAGP